MKKEEGVIKRKGESLDGWKTVGAKASRAGFIKPIFMSGAEQ